MDFRSQLSAFQSAGAGGGGGSGGNDRTPHRSSNNNTRGYQGGGSGGGGSGHRGRSGYGDDRRRSRDYSPQSRDRGPPHQRRRYHEPDRDGLGDLRHHRYKVPRGHPSPPTEEEKSQAPKHLALLLIIIDELPYEHIWREWCNSVNSANGYHISLLCHAKYPERVQSEWLKQRLLVWPPKLGRGNSYLDPQFLTRSPEWGSIEITRVMLDLLSAGLKIGNDPEKDERFSTNRFVVYPSTMSGETIPQVDQFLFISETCLPVATAQEFFDTMDNTVSWVNARHRKDPDTPKNAYENDQFGMINRRIPGQYRWKADQWVLLCRKHASQIMSIDRPHIPHKFHLWQSYRDINASDEMYIPTTLALLGFLRFTSEGEDTQRLRGIGTDDREDKPSEPSTPMNTFEFVKKRPITFTDWTTGARNPATFAKGIQDFRKVARLARDKGCLVARKFAPYIIIPGVDRSTLAVTGQITEEEWKQEVDLLKVEYKDKLPQISVKPIPPPATTQTLPVTTDPISDNEEKAESEEQPPVKEAQKEKTAAEKEAENALDDEEENQL